MSDAPDLTRPWGRHDLTDPETAAVRIGACDLWIRKRDTEIRLAHLDRGQGQGEVATWGAGDPPPEPPPDTDWSRWAPPGDADHVFLRPALPDRAVVLKPEWPFRLLPGAEARVFVRVPVRIRVELPMDGRVHLLAAVPSIAMSDTWFGELSVGELAYWLPTTARRTVAARRFAPFLAVCPVHMRNETDGELQVDKLALRVAHLSLFQAGDRLWADESRVRYLGGEDGSQIEMSGTAPPEAGEAVLVSAPGALAQKGFRARTFDRLRAFHGLGGA